MPKKFNVGPYDSRHRDNLARRARRVLRLFDAAARRAAQSAAPTLAKAAPSGEFSFGDYPALKMEVDALLRDLCDSLQTNIEEGDRESWTLSNAKNDAMVAAVAGKSRLPEATVKSWTHPRLEALSAFIDRKEAGMSLSRRVWNLTEQFRGELELALELGMGEGKSAAELSRDVRRFLKYPDKLFRRVRDKSGALRLSKAAAAFHPGRGVYRSSYKNALRMTATENNIAYRTADHTRWQSLPFVLGIEVHLSNNHPTEDICDIFDGKRFPKDFKFTGWHPWCRCYAVSVLASEEEMDAYTRAIIDGKDVSGWQFSGKVETMPKEFDQWLRDNEERAKTATSMPYFIKDNTKYVPKSFIDVFGSLKTSRLENVGTSLKSASLGIKDPTLITDAEVKTAIRNFAAANPSMFNGGLSDVVITRAESATGFMANRRYYLKADGSYDIKRGNTLYIVDKDFTTASGTVFNPLHEVKGALKAVTLKEPLTFNQEYALESVWHEIRHAAAVGWKDHRNFTKTQTDAMETVNQFCARISYPNFIKSLGGKATHTRKVMEKGYGYNVSVSNFNTLLKHMKVSKKAAYRHFQEMIIKTPYENIYGELVKFVEEKGKYETKQAESIVSKLALNPKAFNTNL